MQRALFLLLLFLLSAVLGGQATTLNGKIVFETNRDGPSGIYPIVYERERRSHELSKPS